MGRKWANIVAKKTALDQANSRVYAKFGIEIYAAAKTGDINPHSNPKLKFILERAKQANVPKHIIDRAINKAKGNADETFQELRYEGFGPSGSMIIVDTLTSNVNRTAANVRTAFNKNGGNMGSLGSVSYSFDHTGVLVFKGEDADSLLEYLMEENIDIRDVLEEKSSIIVYTQPEALSLAKEALEKKDVHEFDVLELEMIAQNEINLSAGNLEKFAKIINALEEDEDVQKVFHNVENYLF
ncbi:MAG: YebC/PmpR family DNA-binding transcriptional regulator [Streptococcaceae bacterium]|jgi:YebC/PmpR family DNA-binding regulatory protein|nr:YebC/PmpR family DNA-binding transcriptional regulator [Streptococcaceae bacterium]